MLTDFLRDQAFAVAWLSVMAAGWFGWSQEDPKPQLRGVWGSGSALGLLLATAFGILVWRHWSTPTTLDGDYWIFGLIVVAETVLIGGGCLVLARQKRSRWFGWWIGLCVALHFVPLAWVFDDVSYLALTGVQVAGLVLMFPALKRSGHATSRWACPWIAGTFLLFALVSGAAFLLHHGYPF